MSRWSVSTHTCCNNSQLIPVTAAMICLRGSGRSCGKGGRKTESFTYHYKKKNGMVLSQVVLVASKAVSGLLQWVWQMWIVSLATAVSQRADTWSAYEVCTKRKKNLKRVSLSNCWSDFTILSANQVCQCYEMCQGTMNNPVPSTVLLLWSNICRPVCSTEIWWITPVFLKRITYQTEHRDVQVKKGWSCRQYWQFWWEVSQEQQLQH